MSSSTRLRYWIGASAHTILDRAASAHLLPERFPKGLHLEYDLRRALAQPITTIIDGGANVGNTAIQFCRHFKSSTIHAFEPVDTTFQRLEKRVKDYPRILCQPFALGEREEELHINLSSDSETNSLWSSTDAPGAANSTVVRVICLDEYAETRGLQKIDVLKLDLEGYELPALRGAARLLKRGAVRAVYSECSFLASNQRETPFGKLHEELTMYGFRFAGFYQTYRDGPSKCWVRFSNGLWLLP